MCMSVRGPGGCGGGVSREEREEGGNEWTHSSTLFHAAHPFVHHTFFFPLPHTKKAVCCSCLLLLCIVTVLVRAALSWRMLLSRLLFLF